MKSVVFILQALRLADCCCCLLQQLVKRERAVRDGYGIETVSSDRGILLGIILNFCHFLSVLRGLTLEVEERRVKSEELLRSPRLIIELAAILSFDD